MSIFSCHILDACLLYIIKQVEWNGDWSDNSSQWNSLDEAEREEIGLVKAKDGEFWMSFSDFVRNWTHVQICHLSANSFSDELIEKDDDSDIHWKVTQFNSSWVVGSTAGGCGNGDAAAFWTNPQFLVQLFDVDRDDEEAKATLIVSLMQKDSRLKRMQTGRDSCEEYIQFKVRAVTLYLFEKKFTIFAFVRFRTIVLGCPSVCLSVRKKVFLFFWIFFFNSI